MTTDTVSLFLALLALLAEAGAAAALVLAVGGRFSQPLRRFRQQAVEAVGPSALTLAFAVAAVCMSGSLYFSEVAHYPPCHLCWFQRFCMYPLVPLLGWAAWRHHVRLVPYAALLAVVGSVISTYHVLLERHPEWESTICDPRNPCTQIWVKRFGYLTIPAMALSGFAAILALLATARAAHRAGSPSRVSV